MADGEQYTTMCGGVVTSSVRRRCCNKANHLKVRFIFNLLGQLKYIWSWNMKTEWAAVCFKYSAELLDSVLGHDVRGD